MKVIPTEVALLITATLIGGSVLVSVIRTRRLPKEAGAEEASRWWVPGSPPKARPAEPRDPLGGARRGR